MTHNSASCVGRCLDALSEMAQTVTPVVIDNASSDATVEIARNRGQVRLIANRENLGFAAAVNQGVRSFHSEYYLLLNPDVELLTGLDRLVDRAQEFGLAAGKLVDATGNPQAGFTIRRFPTAVTFWFELLGVNRLWPSNQVNRRYRYLDRDLETSGPVEQPAGAFLMIRDDVWVRLGGLDQGFHPIWFEDVDLCLRAAELGYKPYFEPKVAGRHQGGHSISRIDVGSRQRFWCASLLRYAAKHFHPLAYRGVCLAVLLTSIPRAAVGMIRERSLSPVLSCIKIVGFSGRCLVSGAVPGRFS